MPDYELARLTGLQRPSAIRRWLDRNKIPYINGADGRPRVLQIIIIERMGGAAVMPPASEPKLRLRHA